MSSSSQDKGKGSIECRNTQLSLFDHSMVVHAGVGQLPLCTTMPGKARCMMENEEKKPRKTYRQEWHEYNLAQTHEKAKFQELLYSLCQCVEEPPQEIGRPRVPLSDRLFSITFKVYSTLSGRRFASDLRAAYQRGYVTELPHYNSMFRYLKSEELTPCLKELIKQSSLPLKAIETDFAVDSSGFSTCNFTRWFDVKYGNTEDWRDWIKLHLICGVKTNIVTGVETGGKHANDSPFFKPLVNRTAANGFTLREVSADKGYDSFTNRCTALTKNAIPYIPYREGEKHKPNPSGKGELWKRMYYFYSLHQEEFYRHYHKRSNVESTFSMIKAKFGERIRSKTETAQINEALCKVLAHNLCCLIQSIYELGIEATFEAKPQPASKVIPFPEI